VAASQQDKNYVPAKALRAHAIGFGCSRGDRPVPVTRTEVYISKSNKPVEFPNVREDDDAIPLRAAEHFCARLGIPMIQVAND